MQIINNRHRSVVIQDPTATHLFNLVQFYFTTTSNIPMEPKGGRQYLDYGRRQVRTYAIPLVILRSIDTQWFIYPAKVFLCMGTALGLRAIDLHWRNSID
ncbi:hypothetical protein DPSP01_012741 [Paraphaeosphaeria sporulosa]